MSTPMTSENARATVGAGWARERLWLGMSNVGFWVVAATAILILGAPDLGWGPLDGLLLLAAYVVLQAPFDLLGGWFLQRRHSRGARSVGAFLGSWVRGVAVQALIFTAAGSSALALHALAGPAAVFLGAVVGMVLMLGLQGPLIWLMTGLRTRSLTQDERALASQADLNPAVVRVVDAQDDSFVGGWVGLPGAETLVVPDAWKRALGDDAWVAQLRRRAVARSSGQRLRGVALALAWNLIGLALPLAVFGVGDLDALVRVVAAFTLWSFVGVLVLPTVSRLGVYAVDRAALRAGEDRAAVEAALRALDSLQDDEPARPDVVESIFHPVPGLSRRVDALTEPDDQPTGAWHAARMSLLLGQALASPLSRAVHCNIGRPELWAAYPGD